jgi:hypothetical protein
MRPKITPLVLQEILDEENFVAVELLTNPKAI